MHTSEISMLQLKLIWGCLKANCLFFPFRDIMNNKVFYQHPNLMRVLGMHETVMDVMVNVLGGDKSQVISPQFAMCFAF